MPALAPSGFSQRISLFFAAYFFPYGIYIPFFGVWLKSLGMSSEEIGLVLTIPLIIRVIFTPFTTSLADHLGDRRLTLRIYCVVFVATFGLIIIYDNLIYLCFVMAISHIAQTALLPIADLLAMAGTRRYNLDYGRMRSWGSIAYIAANLVGGYSLDYLGAHRIIWFMVAGNILLILFSITLPIDPRKLDNRTLTKGTRLNWSQIRQFGQPGFWVVLIAAGLLQASHGMLYGFATIHWQAIGIASNMTGIFWSVSVAAEVLVFVFSRRLFPKSGWKTLLVIGALSGVLRWSLFPLPLPESGMLLLQILHAGSFGCTHLGTMFFIAHAVDDELSGTAQGLFTMISGLLLAISTFLSGILYARWEGDAFFAMGVISLVALLMVGLARFFPLCRIRVDTSQEA